MLATPHNLSLDPAYAPFLRLTDSVLLTTEEVAKHWRYEKQSLHNMRQAGTGPAYIKLPTGAIRYRHSTILEHDIAGQRGLTLEFISVALATMPGLKPAQREAIEAHLKSLLSESVK